LKETPLRVSGLAYANSIAFTVGVVFLVILARRRLGGIGFHAIIVTLAKSVAGSLPMTALLVLFLRWKPELYLNGGSFGATVMIAAVVLVCVGLTICMYALLRVPFLADLVTRRRKE